MLRAGTALGILIIATAQANAGAFAIREQSTYGQGTSFAGVAAGGSLSSMFWNPATMTQFKGIVRRIRFLNDLSARQPDAAARQHARRTAFLFSGRVQQRRQCTGGEWLHDLSAKPNLWMGLGINAPFGLSVSFQDPWAGRNYRPRYDHKILQRESHYRISHQRLDQHRRRRAGSVCDRSYIFGSNSVPAHRGSLDGKGWGFGATAGVTFTPWANTTIGLGWRSAINQDIHGTLMVPPGSPAARPVRRSSRPTFPTSSALVFATSLTLAGQSWVRLSGVTGAGLARSTSIN